MDWAMPHRGASVGRDHRMGWHDERRTWHDGDVPGHVPTHLGRHDGRHDVPVGGADGYRVDSLGGRSTEFARSRSRHRLIPRGGRLFPTNALEGGLPPSLPDTAGFAFPLREL